jgi:hypothetical protein
MLKSPAGRPRPRPYFAYKIFGFGSHHPGGGSIFRVNQKRYLRKISTPNLLYQGGRDSGPGLSFFQRSFAAWPGGPDVGVYACVQAQADQEAWWGGSRRPRRPGSAGRGRTGGRTVHLSSRSLLPSLTSSLLGHVQRHGQDQPSGIIVFVWMMRLWRFWLVVAVDCGLKVRMHRRS